ncbi:lytic polysaccharide monooxygenase [Zopfia rhizophila CBS 207.26]|uniref:lytic cellulose monooxygenase (C4-dehydrogenating) n=1 Tax=Zopfia rhizophila CBS 207.26 TaxID=1314779 RepID=A0A6A6EBU0_9PEZI|nr:lytic polysaccharide monooxygenase [Zopfia rhizophila CBS 207.26]
MIVLIIAFLATQLLCSARGHYVFSRFLVNNTVTEQWQYVRNLTLGESLSPPFNDQYMPYYDIYDANVRCGRGAATSGPGTETATVMAGDEVGFVVGRSADEPLQPYVIYHNGPGQAYLSKAPTDDLNHYIGDGDWFKIGALVAKNDMAWVTRDQTGMNFTIPKTTPPGKYLLRVEHLYVQSTFNSTQFYISCAQINIVGPGGGIPGPMVKFPGAYDLSDPGIWVPIDYYDYPPRNLTRYVPPGPPVWKG